MSNVIYLEDRLEREVTIPQRYVIQNGVDVDLTFRSGSYKGPLSETTERHFNQIMGLFNLLEHTLGEGYAGAVNSVFYDDKTDMGHSILVYAGFLRCHDLPVTFGLVELSDGDCVVPVEIVAADEPGPVA